MNKWSLRWAILFITLALSGLVVLQVRWIRQAVRLKEQRFDQSVAEMMMSVSKKVETMDAVSNLKTKLTPVKQSNTISFAMRDSVDGDLKHPNETPKQESYYIQKDIEIKQHSTIRVDAPPPLMPHEVRKVIHLGNKEDGSNDLLVGNDTITLDDSLLNQSNYSFYRTAIDNYTDFFKEMALNFMLENKPLSERIRKKSLDSLIATEMGAYGLNTPYHYGVYESDRDSFVFASNETKLPSFKEAKYKVGLFRNDPFYNYGFLLMDFPQKSTYLLRSMWIQLASSVLFILVIASGFIYMVSTIFRQKRLSNMKTDFINNMTHEFKTPVATISLASEMIQRESKSASANGTVKKFADIIYEENKRLARQVDKVLQIATLEKEDYQFKKMEVDLHELIEAEVSKFAFRIHNREGTIEMDLDAKDHIFYCDELHMRNIINNLLDNAEKYSPEIPVIKVSTRNEEGSIIIAVEDQGIGMTRDQQKRIFDRFYRADSGDLHNVKGFGLGLSYVKLVTEKHGGHVKVESTFAKGSRFEIILPVLQHENINNQSA